MNDNILPAMQAVYFFTELLKVGLELAETMIPVATGWFMCNWYHGRRRYLEKK